MRFVGVMSAAIVAVAAVSFAPDAAAQRGGRNQAASVVVINFQRVLSESVLGRDMSAKLQQIRSQVAQEAQALQPEGAAIEQEAQRLAVATRNMTPEQIRNNATYAPQFQSFQQRRQQFQARQQGLQGDLECTQVFALRDFDRLSSPILRSTMESRGAGVVVDATNVLQLLPEFDITNSVIQQLDQNPASRTATVSRHALAECQAQQPAGQ